MLIITCGLPGAGKSTVAQRLADGTGFAIISSDIVRKELAGLSPEEHRYEIFGKGIYAADFTDRTYAELLQRAKRQLVEGHSVILDASFIRRSQRRLAERVANETGAQFACILIEARSETVRRRLDRRLERGAGPSDARWATYLAQKRRFQRPSEIAAERLMALRPLSPNTNLRPIVRWLKGLSPLSVLTPVVVELA
jgi:predicted kinase